MLINFCNKYFFRKIVVVNLLVLALTGCRQTIYETRPKRSDLITSSSKISNADKVLTLAKNFASGHKSAKEVRLAFEDLNKKELTELYEKHEGISSFVAFMALGPLDVDSIFVMEKSVNEISHMVLLFSKLLSRLNSSTLTTITAGLTPNNLDAFVSWAFHNSAQGKPAFKNFYKKIPSMRQQLRSLLLENCMQSIPRKDAVKKIIDEANEWGIGATSTTDVYDLFSRPPITKFSGTLLKVLARYLIEEYSRTQDPSLFLELREYAESIKLLMGDKEYQESITKPSAPNLPAIKDLVKNALMLSHRHYWTNYYLAVDEINDVLKAAKDSAVSNDMLHELYSFIITDNKKAMALAEESEGPHFIHYLCERPSDENIFEVLDDFLEKASALDPELQLPILTDQTGDGNKNAIQIIRKATRPAQDQAFFHQRIYERLLKNDNGEGVSKLSHDELDILVKKAFTTSRFNSNGMTEFKSLVLKISSTKAYAEKEALSKLLGLRSELLKLAYELGPHSLENLVKQILDKTDPWGLNASVNTDVYQLGAIQGTLLWVLAKDAVTKFSTKPHLLSELRNYAVHWKMTQGDAAFHSYIATPIKENGNVAIKQLVDDLLGPQNRADFTDYYFASELPKNVYDAASKNEKIFTNAMLKEIYDLIIGDVPSLADALREEPQDLKRDNFIHHLLRRSADEDTAYLLNKYLSGLFASEKFAAMGAQKENSQLLLTNNNNDQPLRLFIVRPQGFLENAGKKMQMLSRMLSHANENAWMGITPAELAKLVPMISSDPSLFKKIYRFFAANSLEAQALRSALIATFYDHGSYQMKKLLNEFTHASDIWGVKESVTNFTQTYDFKENTDGTCYSGPLLYVLVMRAIKDGNNKAMSILNEYATIIKNSFASVSDYDNFVTKELFGPAQKTIKTLLEEALAPSGRQFFANSFLAKVDVLDVFDAAGESESKFNNAMLKSLYLSVIGHDQKKVALLGNHVGEGSEKFIQRVVARSADQNSFYVLKFFLDDLGVKNELDQLSLTSRKGRVPLQMLMDTSRRDHALRAATDEGDHALWKTKMIDRMLAFDDGTALKTITPFEFSRLRIFFGAGDDGKALFQKLYKNPIFGSGATDGYAITKALRSSLINEAALLKKEKEVVAQIAQARDPWALREGLTKDDYEADSEIHISETIDKSLLYGLTERAIQKFSASSRDFSAFKNLRSCALDLHRAVETNPGDYVAYAQKSTSNAVLMLRTYLETCALPQGLAEYYLDLDATVPGFDEKLVMAAAAHVIEPGVFDTNHLKWIYENAINTDSKAVALAELLSSTNENFLALLLARPTSAASNAILENYLSRILKNAGSSFTENHLLAKNFHGQNALQIITQKNRADGGVERNKAIVLLAMLANKFMVEPLNSDEVHLMLSALRDVGKPDDLAQAFTLFDDAQMPLVALWSADKKAVIKKGGSGTFLKDNLENQNISFAFKREFNARPAVQEVMRNSLVRKAFLVGAEESLRKGALLRAARLIEIDFFDDVILTDFNWRPFSSDSAKKSGLIFALLEQAEPSKQEEVIELIANMKNKFNSLDEWRDYLDNRNNPNGFSTLLLVQNIIARLYPKHTSEENTAQAKHWLKYD